MVLKSKQSSLGYGRIEIRQLSNGNYALYINGDLKQQSPTLSYIEGEYNKY